MVRENIYGNFIEYVLHYLRNTYVFPLILNQNPCRDTRSFSAIHHEMIAEDTFRITTKHCKCINRNEIDSFYGDTTDRSTLEVGVPMMGEIMRTLC